MTKGNRTTIGGDVKFVLVNFDGLRPDLVRPDITPNLCRLAQAGVRFLNHRTTFPSETMVAFTSLITGAPPSVHGIVSNEYIDNRVYQARVFNTASVEDIEAGDVAYAGGLITAETIGQTLHRADRRFAIISSNSPGCTRLINRKVNTPGQFSLSVHHPKYSYPRSHVEQVVRRFGLAPHPTLPDNGATEYATSVFLDYVWPELSPDVTIIAYNEPDMSFHYLGLGSERALEGIRWTDHQFGRILDWWERHPSIQLLVTSDHGHVTQTQNTSVRTMLNEAGLSIGEMSTNEGVIGLIPGHVGKVTIPIGRRDLLERVVAALSEQAWCGMLICDGEHSIPGTIAQIDVLVDHPRSPNLYYTLRSSDAVGRFGLPGTSWSDDDMLFDGAGYHGGLHAQELNCVAIFAGSLFRAGVITPVHSGIVDIAPTILHALNIPAPRSMIGRVLHEAMIGDWTSPPSIRLNDVVGVRGPYCQTLQRFQVAGVTYLDHGFRQ